MGGGTIRASGPSQECRHVAAAPRSSVTSAWRATGRIACVNLVSGAGLTHAMSGISEAFLNHVPMLVLGCGIGPDLRKAFQLHDVDQEATVRPAVKGTVVLRDGELAQISQFRSTAMNRKAPSALYDYELKHFAARVLSAYPRRRWRGGGTAGSGPDLWVWPPGSRRGRHRLHSQNVLHQGSCESEPAPLPLRYRVVSSDGRVRRKFTG